MGQSTLHQPCSIHNPTIIISLYHICLEWSGFTVSNCSTAQITLWTIDGGIDKSYKVAPVWSNQVILYGSPS